MSKVVGYAQTVVRLRTIDGREIVRCLTNPAREPLQEFRLESGEYLIRADEIPGLLSPDVIRPTKSHKLIAEEAILQDLPFCLEEAVERLRIYHQRQYEAIMRGDGSGSY